MNIFDRLKDPSESVFDKLLRAGLESAAGEFGFVPQANQDPTPVQIQNGQLGSQPDRTIYERPVIDQASLRNNYFDISGFMSNPLYIVGGLVGLAVVLGLFLRGRK